MFSGPDPFQMASYDQCIGDVSDLAYVMQGIWQKILWLLALPHIVTILELVLEFILLTSYLFISWRMFGVCYGGCMSIGNALLYYVLLCVELWTYHIVRQ